MFYQFKQHLDWRRQSVTWRRQLRTKCLFQIALILLVWQAGEWLVRWLVLPIPGSVLGMLLLLGMLWYGGCHVADLRKGTRWFLAQMLLFLLPTVASLLDHPEFFGWLGLKLLAAVCAGTLTVMIVTALLMDACHRWLAAEPAPAPIVNPNHQG
jgi:holin-like protein